MMRLQAGKIAIYKIVCSVNGKVYIGQSKNPMKRWNEHCNSLNAGRHHSARLQRAWNKYGGESFVHSIIEFCDPSSADERERYWIKFFDSTNKHRGFNIEGGGNSNKAVSDETRIKLKIAHQKRYEIAKQYLNSPEAIEKRRIKLSGTNNPMYGRKHSAETRTRMSMIRKGRMAGTNNPMYGKPVSKERRELYSRLFSGEGNPFYGRHHTEETRQKIREKAIGRTHSDEARRKMSLKRRGKDNPAARKVLCITTGLEFDTAREAAEYYGVHPNGVRMCCRGERKYAGKLPDGTELKWIYIDDRLPQGGFFNS